MATCKTFKQSTFDFMFQKPYREVAIQRPTVQSLKVAEYKTNIYYVKKSS